MRFARTLAAVGAGTLGGLLVAQRTLVVVRVTGAGMAPGDRVLIRRTKRLKRGQLVVLQRALPGGVWRTGPLPAPRAQRWFMKQVVAVAGDPVPPDIAKSIGEPVGTLVEAGRIVVLGGDDPDDEDSRVWGHVPVDRVLGVVVRNLSPKDPKEPKDLT